MHCEVDRSDGPPYTKSMHIPIAQVCGEVILLKALRIGVEVNEKGWGVITRWQVLKPRPHWNARLPATLRLPKSAAPAIIPLVLTNRPSSPPPCVLAAPRMHTVAMVERGRRRA